MTTGGTTADSAGTRTPTTLRRGVLGARHVVFFVIAAAAPLGFSVGAIPLAVGRGGIGTAGMFLVCGAILAVFAVGYVAMAAHIRRVGGLYLFVMEGLGRPLGLATSFLAVLTYAVAATGAVGVFAVFAQQAAQDLLLLDTPWQLWALVCVVAMATLGVLGAELNAKVLGAVIVGEILILLVVSAAVTLAGGAEGLSGNAFAPGTVFGSAPGAMLAITISAFAGFEATVLFAEEVRDGARTVRRATFAAIAVMVALYAFVTWAVVQAFGDRGAVTAANTDPVAMFFDAAERFLGLWAAGVMELLVVTSWFASVLAFHNAAARYVFALGRDRVLPAFWGRTSPRFGSPWTASLGHSAFTLVVVLAFVLVQADPYLDLYVLGSTPAVVGIPVLELLASVAVFAFFARDRRGLPAWQVLVCPLVATVALAVVVWLIVDQIDLFTARTGVVNVLLPGLILLTLAAGLGRALALRSRRPEVYAALGSTGPTP